MFRGYRGVLAGLAGLTALIFGIVLGFSLQPEQPKFSGNVGYKPVVSTYKPGGPDCEPKKIYSLSPKERTEQAVACQQAAEQHRLDSNDLIQQRRSADAADAMTIFAYQQTRIAAWGLSLGFITMFAAIFAAFYAREAARHTETSANSFADAERAILHAIGGSVTKPMEDKKTGVTIELINRGRSQARVTEFGVKSYNKSYPRWTIIAPEKKTLVSGFEGPPKDQRLELECWIKYKSLGPKIHKSYFTVTVYWLEDNFSGLHLLPRWVVKVSNPEGHPADT
jgi:hypothetical protein